VSKNGPKQIPAAGPAPLHPRDAEKAVRTIRQRHYERPMPVATASLFNFPRCRAHPRLGPSGALTFARAGENSATSSSGMSGAVATTSCAIREPVENVDYLQIESTYGGRVHSEKRTATERGRPARARSDRSANGKVIIPAFSCGRTQQNRYSLAPAHRAAAVAASADLRGQPLSVTPATRSVSPSPRNVSTRRCINSSVKEPTRSHERAYLTSARWPNQ